jgi:hypothetical protein
MHFLQYQSAYNTFLGVKDVPNAHEEYLFARAEKYLRKILWIPGIQMIAVVNSLSQYATHPDSDIDLFVVTRPKHMWWVRFCLTSVFLFSGVWRKGSEVRENFCLSFFIEEEHLSLEHIAIDQDIYLWYWIYHMKPMIDRNNTYERFLHANSWVHVDADMREKNRIYRIIETGTPLFERFPFLFSLTESFDTLIRYFGARKAFRTWKKKGSPWGVIITPTMLKFHDADRRKEIRDALLQN